MVKKRSVIMKKLVVIGIAIVLFASCQILSFGSTADMNESNSVFSEMELKIIKSAMMDRDIYGEKLYIDILYNNHGQQAFILCASEKGYSIINRADYTCIETMESNNSPYDKYKNAKKYYAGLSGYFANDGSGNYDIGSSRYINNIPNSQYKGNVDVIKNVDDFLSNSQKIEVNKAIKILKSALLKRVMVWQKLLVIQMLISGELLSDIMMTTVAQQLPLD